MTILNRIDEIGEEIVELDAERKQLREIYDGRFIAAAEITRLKQEIEKLAIDSVVLDKIIVLIEEDDQCDIRTAHDAFELIHDIRKIIDERGD